VRASFVKGFATIPDVPFDRSQIEARLTLDLVASADMPKVAWDALEAGLDGPAIRRLAVLERPTYFEVAEVLPAARREMGLATIRVERAAVRVAKEIAGEILSRDDDPRGRLRELEMLWVRSGYARELQTLGTLHDEVWISNQPETTIRSWVKSRVKEFIRVHKDD
jgi:hypothetical protein